MSTSMYVHVEKRVGDRWVHVPPPDIPTWEGGSPDDWYASYTQSYDDMAVLCNERNYDGYKSVVEEPRGAPLDLSEELWEIISERLDSDHCATWMTLAEIEAYDFDQTVIMPVRVYSPEELAKLGWRGNGDGTPYTDVGRRGHTLVGYTDQPVVVRTQVPFLFILTDRIRKETPGVPSDQIRLVILTD